MLMNEHFAVVGHVASVADVSPKRLNEPINSPKFFGPIFAGRFWMRPAVNLLGIEDEGTTEVCVSPAPQEPSSVKAVFLLL